MFSASVSVGIGAHLSHPVGRLAVGGFQFSSAEQRQFRELRNCTSYSLACVRGDLVIARLETGASGAEASGACDCRRPAGARASTYGIWDLRPLVGYEYSPYRLMSCTFCVECTKRNDRARRPARASTVPPGRSLRPTPSSDDGVDQARHFGKQPSVVTEHRSQRSRSSWRPRRARRGPARPGGLCSRIVGFLQVDGAGFE